MIAHPTPLYIVCSPCRGVGKTLLARLLTELSALDDRPVQAFDLADEGPQLADFLPQLTTVTGIGDVAGQMTFFERLIADNSSTTIVDVSYRAFERFFTVVHEIDFFAEARRQAIEPLILFITAPDARSPRAYAVLRQRFLEASLLPVYNQVETPTLSGDDIAPASDALPSMLEIPRLGFALQALVDRPTFSFRALWDASPADLPAALEDALRDWIDGIARQLHAVALAIGCEGPATSMALPRQDRRDSPSLASELPEALRTFAPKKLRADDALLSAGTIVDLLRRAGRELRDAEERINALETEVEHYQDRAVRAEAWLTKLRREIEEKLIVPAAANRAKLDDLSLPHPNAPSTVADDPPERGRG
jgi:hypothetical protein